MWGLLNIAMNDLEFCQSVIEQVRLIQNECYDLLVNTTKIIESHSAILEVCRNNYRKVENLQSICRTLLDQVDKVIAKMREESPLEEELLEEGTSTSFLPATTKLPGTYLANDVVDAAIRCLKQLHIVGMSQETILVWPFKEAPKAIQEMALAAGVPAAVWAAVFPPNTKAWASFSPLKSGFALRFSTGHEVIYGVE